MKKMFFTLAASILTAAISFGATNWGHSVQMDQNYVLLSRSQIILSNLLAVAAGDLSGTTNNSIVIGLRGKSIPLPDAGDGGKVYAYNSGTGAFELVSLGSVAYAAEAGHATNANYSLSSLYATNSGTAGYATNETLVSITARGSNTTENIGLLNWHTTIGKSDSGATEVWSPAYWPQLNVGHLSSTSIRTNSGYGSMCFGYLTSGGRQTATGQAALNSGYVPGGHQIASGAAAMNFGYPKNGTQIASGIGSVNIGSFTASSDYQETSGDGCLTVGCNITNSHNYSMVFGSGLNSIETNAVHARKYYENGTSLVDKYESKIRTVEVKTDNYNVLTNDVGKTFVMNTASKTNFLPSVDSSNIGVWYTFVKHNAGTLTIKAADTDQIADSGQGDTIYDSQAAEVYATITLQLVTSTNWVITGAHGTWTTTD